MQPLNHITVFGSQSVDPTAVAQPLPATPFSLPPSANCLPATQQVPGPGAHPLECAAGSSSPLSQYSAFHVWKCFYSHLFLWPSQHSREAGRIIISFPLYRWGSWVTDWWNEPPRDGQVVMAGFRAWAGFLGLFSFKQPPPITASFLFTILILCLFFCLLLYDLSL